MKVMILAVSCLLALSGALAADTCYQDVSLDCGQASNSLALPRCNAVYGEYGRHGNVATELQAYANLHLERSYEYLLSAAYFNNYQTNRLGFSKLFKKLSDEAWEKTIDIIKHVAQYLEEEFIEDQAKKIRELAGHTTDLKKFITSNHGQDLSIALYLFDEYLQKVA
ncbi:hypothetical protein HF086_009540 [Spodoptera exigua]|uniref:Ferritin n=1 Tax=Spodoptera exigua TaxID=7107 RepID=A0A922MDR8_SPOEX|nr:hypothetical protein HF086_009540 [Spodoptera exigua]